MPIKIPKLDYYGPSQYVAYKDVQDIAYNVKIALWDDLTAEKKGEEYVADHEDQYYRYWFSPHYLYSTDNANRYPPMLMFQRIEKDPFKQYGNKCEYVINLKTLKPTVKSPIQTSLPEDVVKRIRERIKAMPEVIRDDPLPPEKIPLV